jgi:hypothetical protein
MLKTVRTPPHHRHPDGPPAHLPTALRFTRRGSLYSYRTFLCHVGPDLPPARDDPPPSSLRPVNLMPISQQAANRR